MKAMILAAGLGTRLKPITDTIPKCMVPIAGSPLIGHQIQWLKRHGIKDIAINLHYLHDAVTEYLGDGSGFGVNITYSHEEKLLGTAGAVKKMDQYFTDTFLVVYGDIFTDLLLAPLFDLHHQSDALVTMCVAKRDRKKRSNKIIIDDDHKITTFVEKPTHGSNGLDAPNIANCGIYVCDPAMLQQLPDGFSDFGNDIFPALVQSHKVVAYPLPKNMHWYELGRLEKYQKFKPKIESLISSQQ